MARPRSRVAGDKPLPFSLVLPPDELEVLRKIARQDGVAVGTIIRRAIYTVIYRVNPRLINRMLETEVDEFLDQLAQRFPASILSGWKGKAFQRRLGEMLV